jgi:hypothetical protein
MRIHHLLHRTNSVNLSACRQNRLTEEQTMELTRSEVEAHIDRARRLRSAAVGEIFAKLWQTSRNGTISQLKRLRSSATASAPALFRTQD